MHLRIGLNPNSTSGRTDNGNENDQQDREHDA